MKSIPATAVRTYHGLIVDVLNPDPTQIFIEDIAHSLSQLCRFGGHTDQLYSVAQHCVIMSELDFIPEELRMTALLHDAPEAYMVDVPRPLKRLLDKYMEIENNMHQVIAAAFGLPYPFPEIIHHADEWMLQREFKLFFDGGPGIYWTSKQAEQLFIDTYYKLAHR